MLEIGCGTGKVSVAAAQRVKKVFSLDKRPEAIKTAREAAERNPLHNIEFFCTDAVDFLASDRIFDCAFVGGTQQLARILRSWQKKCEERLW